jgi:hypothetical protein
MSAAASDASPVTSEWEIVQRGSWLTALETGEDSEKLRDLICPITGKIMNEPVLAKDGVTCVRVLLAKARTPFSSSNLA